MPALRTISAARRLPRRFGLPPLALTALLCSTAAMAGNTFCGGAPANPTSPSDLANVEGDMTVQHAAGLPASPVVCAQGYMAEKCGDHETALRIFDKCIAAGYTGALIWKALMYESGSGLPQDSTKAAELLHRAALAGHDGYSTLGKLHYATVLHEGRGVKRNEIEARKWFETAAAEGSEDAKEFLRTGRHAGSRDLQGRSVGAPGSMGAAADAANAAAPPEPAVKGLTLKRVDTQSTLPATPIWLGLVAAALIASGALHQALRRSGAR